MTLRIETAFLANHAEFHDGLAFVNGGFPEWWNTPSWGLLQPFFLVVVSSVAAEERANEHELEVVFRRVDGSESPLVRARIAGGEVRQGDPVLPEYRFSVGLGVMVDFRAEGIHRFVGRLDDQSFDIPLYVRLLPLPERRSFSARGGSGEGTDRIVIEKASYGSGLVTKDVTDLLQKAVNPSGLSLLVSNETMGGDPVLGEVKHLTVSFRERAGGELRVIDAQEGQELVLP